MHEDPAWLDNTRHEGNVTMEKAISRLEADDSCFQWSNFAMIACSLMESMQSSHATESTLIPKAFREVTGLHTSLALPESLSVRMPYAMDRRSRAHWPEVIQTSGNRCSPLLEISVSSPSLCQMDSIGCESSGIDWSPSLAAQ